MPLKTQFFLVIFYAICQPVVEPNCYRLYPKWQHQIRLLFRCNFLQYFLSVCYFSKNPIVFFGILQRELRVCYRKHIFKITCSYSAVFYDMNISILLFVTVEISKNSKEPSSTFKRKSQKTRYNSIIFFTYNNTIHRLGTKCNIL